MLNWPGLLRRPEFEELRLSIDELVAVGPSALRQHGSEIDRGAMEMRELMKAFVGEVNATEYAAAGKFLRSLRYESQTRPPQPDASPAQHRGRSLRTEGKTTSRIENCSRAPSLVLNCKSNPPGGIVFPGFPNPAYVAGSIVWRSLIFRTPRRLLTLLEIIGADHESLNEPPKFLDLASLLQQHLTQILRRALEVREADLQVGDPINDPVVASLGIG